MQLDPRLPPAVVSSFVPPSGPGLNSSLVADYVVLPLQDGHTLALVSLSSSLHVADDIKANC